MSKNNPVTIYQPPAVFVIKAKHKKKQDNGHYVAEDKRWGILYKAVGSPKLATRYSSVAEAENAIFTMKRELPPEVEFNIETYRPKAPKRKGHYSSPSRGSGGPPKQQNKQKQKKKHKGKRRERVIVPLTPSQQAALDRIQRMADRPSRRPIKNINAESPTREGNDCFSCGVCRECMEREQDWLSKIIKKSE